MMKSIIKISLGALLIGGLVGPFTPLSTSYAADQTENLAFKILQKQAAEYETALSALITKKLAKYVPEDRFHLSVRIYWNPSRVEQLRAKNKELRHKKGKLPGFNVFIKSEEQGIDYYLGAGSVMKLKVEVLIDESLPAQFTRFIHEVVPVQARFVPERGDSVKVVPIPFPAGRKKIVQPADIPLTADEASEAVLDSIAKGKKQLEDIQPIILNPVLQKYVADYEEFVKAKLNNLITEYIDKKKYILNVKFFWNPDEINKLKKLVVRSDAEGKVKLPGFSIYLEERDSLYDTIASSSTLMKMEVMVMLDETVSPEVEPFLQKLIPLSVKIIPARGDKLTIYRGFFPKLRERAGKITDKTSDIVLQTAEDALSEIDQAYEDKNYRKGLILIDLRLSKAASASERLPLLKKKGTFHLLLQEKEMAKATWEQAKRIDPSDTEIGQLLEYLK